jgi:proteic killer suppression protein
MIVSFRCRATAGLFDGNDTGIFPPDIFRRALRKLLILDAAHDLRDLRVPPGNQLERLAGNRRGQHSIRINDQWRICFVWLDGNAHDVEVVDYHK